MKKITNLFALLLVACLAFSVSACTKNESQSNILLNAQVSWNDIVSTTDGQPTSDKVLAIGVQIGLMEDGLVLKPSDFTLEYNGTKISADFFLKTWSTSSMKVNGLDVVVYAITTTQTFDNPENGLYLGFKTDIPDGASTTLSFKGQTVTVG